MVLRFPVFIYTGSSFSIVIRLRAEFLTNVFLFPMGGGGQEILCSPKRPGQLLGH